jgi:ATP-dependent DNA helicase RecQ
LDTKRLVLSREVYDERLSRYKRRIESMLTYASDDAVCRSSYLLGYFGQRNLTPCKQCDVCLSHKDNSLQSSDFERIRNEILHHLQQDKMTLNQLITLIADDENKILEVIRYMSDNKIIRYLGGNLIELIK